MAPAGPGSTGPGMTTAAPVGTGAAGSFLRTPGQQPLSIEESADFSALSTLSP